MKAKELYEKCMQIDKNPDLARTRKAITSDDVLIGFFVATDKFVKDGFLTQEERKALHKLAAEETAKFYYLRNEKDEEDSY